MKKPEPVVITTICSLCDQLWEAHGDKPTTEDCIRLLKAELAKRTLTTFIPQPYPVYPYRYYTTAGQTTAFPTNSGTIKATSTVVQFKRPDDPPDDAVPAKVG